MIEEHRTLSLGEFSFRGFSPGSYTLRLTAEGYEPTEFQPNYRFTSDQALTLYMKAVQQDPSKSSALSSISAHELSMPHAARDLYDSGRRKLYGEKNAIGALEDFQKCLYKAPKFYEAQFQLGMAYLSLGKGHEAEASFRKSIEMSGDKYSEANLALGVLYFDTGDLDAAKSQLHRALELNPSAWMACYKLGDIAYREKSYWEAETWAGKAKAIESRMAMVYELLAQIHVAQKNYLSAVEDLDAYLQLEQDKAKAAQASELRDKLQQLIDQK
jgi:tetratricopeptide (TPR) repeat protein